MSHVLDLCDRWDRLSKGETGTTRQIREAWQKDHPVGMAHLYLGHAEELDFSKFYIDDDEEEGTA